MNSYLYTIAELVNGLRCAIEQLKKDLANAGSF